MLKRIFSLFLAFVMVFGMIPTVAFAQENDAAEPTEKVVVANYGTPLYEDCTIDYSGTGRDKYFMTGKLSDTVSFGTMFQGGYLYFGIDAPVSAVAVELNGKNVSVGGGKSPNAELWVNYRDAGLPLVIPHDYTTTLKLTVDGMVWEGLIRFSSSAWTRTYGGAPATWKCSGSYSGGTNNNGVYNFYVNKDGASTESFLYSYMTFGGGAQQMKEGTSVMDFDLVVDAMPEYDISSLQASGDPHYLFPGLNMGMEHEQNVAGGTRCAGYTYSISRIKDYMDGYDGLYLIIGGTSEHIILPLYQELGESFHLRFEFTRTDATVSQGTLVVYCDDVCLGTFEDVADATGYVTGGFKYGAGTICWVQGAENVQRGEVNVTFSRVIIDKLQAPHLDALDESVILGSNESADLITEPLVLTESLSCACGHCNGTTYELAWTSSNTALMSNDGVPVKNAKGTVTMTASLKALPDVKREFVFTLKGEDPKVINAVFGTPGYNDANIDYSSTVAAPGVDKYLMTGKLSDTVSFGAMYQGGYLYFGIDAAVTDVAVELNGVPITVAGKKAPHAELWVNYRHANLPAIPHDYVTTLKLTVDGMVWEGLIRFDSASWLHLSKGNPAVWKGSGTYNGGSNPDNRGEINFYTNKDGAAAENAEYVYLTLGGSTQLMRQGNSVLDFDLIVDKMPEYDISELETTADPHYLFPGMKLGVMHEMVDNNTRAAGYALAISRIKDYMADYDGLYLIIGSGSDPIIVPLNKGLNEKFHLRVEFNRADPTSTHGDLTVYCDDVLLGTYENVADSSGYIRGQYTKLGVHLMAWAEGAENVAKGEMNFTISKVIYGTSAQPILDTIDIDDILGENESADAITKPLSLPATVSSDQCGSAAVTWTSSDNSIISNAGVPVAGETGEVSMIASLTAFPEITKEFKLTVVKPAVDPDAPADPDDPADPTEIKIINAIYGEPTYDGVLDFSGNSRDKWHLTGKITDEISFGAMYLGNWLYFGINAPTTNVKVELNGKRITVGGPQSPDTEAWVNYTEAGLPCIPHDYVTTLKIIVDGNVWEGLIRFTSPDWIKTSNDPVVAIGSADYNGGSRTNGSMNLYTNQNGISGESEARVYAHMGTTLLYIPEGSAAVGIDLVVDKMPEYDYSSIVTTETPSYLFPGMNMGVIHNNTKDGQQLTAAGYVVAVSRIKGYEEGYDGLYLIVADGETPKIFRLNKGLGEEFHLRFEYTTDTSDGFGGDLAVYCDDAYLGLLEDVSDSRNYSPNAGTTGGVNINNWVKGAENVAAGEVNFTVTRFYVGKLKAPILNELKLEDQLGENASAEMITKPLSLTKALKSGPCGTANLIWTSSDPTIMSNDGVPQPGGIGNVTMTATIKGFPEFSKSFDFYVEAERMDLDAFLATDGITVDGAANELVWVKWREVNAKSEGLPKASMSTVWNRGHLYLMLISDNLTGVELEINGHDIVVDLTNETVTGVEGGKVKVQGDHAEIDIPFGDIAQLSDYNDSIPMNIVLVNEQGSTDVFAKSMIFTGNTVGLRSLSNTSAGWSFSVDTYNFEHLNDASVHYIYSIGNKFSITETTYITQDLYFEELPALEGQYIDGLSTHGYYFYASRNSANYAVEGKGDILFVSIYHNGDGKLKAKIMENQSQPNAVVDLGVSVKEQFRLTAAWAADGSLKLYVNGVLVGQSNGSCTYRRTGCGDNSLSFRYYGNGTDDNVSFQLKNVTVMKETYVNVKAEMTPTAALNRADLERVADDLPMGATFSSQYIGEVPISWITSDPSVVEADGTVHRGETNKTCTISLVFQGETLWTKEVTVLAASITEKTSSALYTTAFANDVVINGDLLNENWHMANKLLTGKGIQVGEMGAAWNCDYLYVAIRNNGNDISLKIKDIEIDLDEVEVAVNGDYTEIAIPMSYLDATITEYGVEMPVEVTAGEGSYKGTLVLSGTDWWGTGNKQQALPVLDGNANSAKTHVDSPDGNQAAVEVDNGWHLYDRYSETGTNPAGIRSYVLFFRTTPYENFNKRDGTTTVEFDFQAHSMPIYDSTATNTQNNDAYACYGVNWVFADACNSQKYSNVVAAGIYNSEEGLILSLRASKLVLVPLNKQVGDLFRITMNWNTDNSLDVYIDGELLITVDNMAQWVSAVGDSCFVLNMLRNLDKPTSSADDMDVYITNIAFGSAYADSLLSTLSWDTIKGENEDINYVTSDLELPQQLVNEQLGYVYPITWTSNEPSVVNPETGAVTAPETGAVAVKLTATLDDGSSKSFTMIVVGNTANAGNVLVLRNDNNPAVGAGKVLETILFTFDQDNNSIIEDMQSKQKVNVVVLTDLDNYARLNRESLTLWISDDNATYTQIEDYKLTQVGRYWYLYDFEAEGRYVKAHYTHWNGDDADFIAPINTIIHASWNDGLVAPDGAAKISAPATTLHDEAAAIALPDGITTENLRVSLNGEILFHYVDKDGTVYVRIPDPTNEELVLWNASDIELANKENVYEITYGTRETYKLDAINPPRWLLNIKAGTYGEHVVEQDMLIATSSTSIYAGNVLVSYDQGLTWEILGNLTSEAKEACVGGGAVGDSGDGGWIFDDETGTIYYACHNVKKFDSAWVGSDAVNVVIASYDMGKTWELVQVIEADIIDGNKYTYMLSYSGGIKVSTYDGEGPGVDFVFPTGSQCANNGSFCSRVAYSTDCGNTWQMSKTIINYGKTLGDESGLSEAWISENDKGVLVLFTRCQYEDAVNFAQAYSYDFGITWTAYESKAEWEADEENRNSKNEIVAKTSSIYSSNTQALMYDYTQYNGIDATLFFWGGNNTLGGTSYLRSPMNVAVSYDGLDTWRNIQNLFSETYLERYNGDGRSLVTNHSVAKVGEDTLRLTFVQNRANYRLGMVVTDFENYFYRTKGVYDSFESGNPHYEGWSAEIGLVENTDKLASEGVQSMHIPKKSILTRSVPYLQNGTITLDIYVTGETAVTYALQPAFGKDPNAYTLATFRVENMKFTNGSTSIDLAEGWNSIEIKLELTAAKAWFSVNGSDAASVDMDIAVGDYVCYFTVFNDTDTYLDEFMVVSDLDAVVYTHELDDEAEIVKFSPSLKDYVALNFYVEVGTEIPEGESYMIFNHNGKEVKVSEYTVTSNGQRKYTYKITAKQMADEISATFYYGNGLYQSKTKTHSVQNYIEYVQGGTEAEHTDALKLLAKDMAQYGAYAQKYFDYNTENYVDVNIEGASDISKVTVDDLAAFAPVVTNNFLDQIGIVLNASLLLKENTILRFAFQGEIPAGMQVLVNGTAVELVKNNGRTYVDISGIAAKNLDEVVVLTIQYNGQVMTVEYAPLSYCYAVLNNASASSDLKDLVKALYLYNQSADAYFSSQS